MIRTSLLIIFTFLSFSSVAAEESDPQKFPLLECNVESSAGNFDSYMPPAAGDKLQLNLNTIEASYKKGAVLKFNNLEDKDNYIPLSSPFVLTVVDNKIEGDRLYMRLRADSSSGKITMDISPFGDFKYQMFVVEESDQIHSIAFLICVQSEK